MSYQDEDDYESSGRLTEYASDSSVENATAGKYRDRFTHRTHTFDKIDVERVEKSAIARMLSVVPEGEAPEVHLKASPTFFSRARVFFPEKFPLLKKSRKTNIYFIEDVGKHLWLRWNAIEDKESDEAIEARNELITYSYPLIDGVIFKYQRHKHMPYDEIFQSAILKLISAIPKFNPERIVGTNDNGTPIYARIYTYLVLSLNYGITHVTMMHGKYKMRLSSYDSISEAVGGADGFTDAGSIFTEFNASLDSLLAEDPLDIPEFTDIDLKVYAKLRELLNSPDDVARLSANPVYVLRTEADLKRSEVIDALSRLAQYMGPLKISSSVISYGSELDLDGDNIKRYQFA